MSNEHQGGDAFHTSLNDIHAENVQVAGRDLINFEGLSQLRPHFVPRAGILPREFYVQPTVEVLRPVSAEERPEPSTGVGVMVIVSDKPSGRRTAALRELDERLPAESPIFELYPDWDEADVALLPARSKVGYLLNLTGSRDALSERFVQQLPGHAERLRIAGSCLVLITDEYVAKGLLAADSSHGAVAVVRFSRPDPFDVVKYRLQTAADGRMRAGWLADDNSVFAGLLSGDESPGDAVHLSRIIKDATGPQDTDAQDRYRGWTHKLKNWFGGDEDPEIRARQIAAACLDGAPARTVLDAADALLRLEEFRWPGRVGGPLAGADDSQRCRDAELRFDEDEGTVSIDAGHPGIGPALLRHVWRNRPQLVPCLSRWLGHITEPGAIADGHLDKVAAALTSIASTEGPGAVLDLVSGWLSGGSSRRRSDVAVDVLARLALHPVHGARVRKELSGWAQAAKRPERQRAVMELCRGEFGRQYPAIALKRLQYVLESDVTDELRGEAVRSIGHLLSDRTQGARTLRTLVGWAGDSKTAPRGTRLFLEVFDADAAEVQDGEPADLSYGLLFRTGESRTFVRQLFQAGWSAVWRHEELRPRAATVLDRWAAAAEAEALPGELVEDIVSAVFTGEADLLSDELNWVVGGSSTFRKRLLHRLVETVSDKTSGRFLADAPEPV